jgi:hypothetical protein
MVTEEDIAKKVICGPDPEKHLQEIHRFAKMGFDHIYIHQIGPQPEEFFQLYEKKILPELR